MALESINLLEVDLDSGVISPKVWNTPSKRELFETGARQALELWNLATQSGQLH